ncbi:hypothetical protein [Mycobacterium sp. ACS4331]|nr:hypothetical protein [Mycobacterium sp. ACS4331]
MSATCQRDELRTLFLESAPGDTRFITVPSLTSSPLTLSPSDTHAAI